MSQANLKTKPEKSDPKDFINQIKDENKKQDCLQLLKLFEQFSKKPAVMWGPSIIGFGHYHYIYASKREGDYFRTGFSPRSKNITIYLMSGYQDMKNYLDKLGKHSIGKSCLYINKLSDIDLDILKQMIEFSLAEMTKLYGEDK
jgi:hypothetical protein